MVSQKMIVKSLTYTIIILKGTKSIIDFMAMHPDLKAAEGEVNFFDRYYNNGLEWYR